MLQRFPLFRSRARGSSFSVCAFFLPVILLIFASFPSLVRAQNPNGSLRGEVQDASAARVAGARVVAQSTGSSITRETRADERGEFRIDGLLPGAYRVTVTAAGFVQAVANIDIAVSLVRDISVTLKPEGGPETVNVQGSTSSITTESVDTASAVHQGVVGSRDLETLPLAARSFANIAYLVPGTAPVEPSDPTKARITAVSTGGSSGLNNELSVDGGDNSDDWIGGFLQNLSPDTIQEFDVRTANEDADTGGTTAGSVVITTKHGTNQWHGDAAFYERAARLNARFPIENPAPNPKQPFSRQNYVGTLGGPLAKNKAWVFASFEHVHENASIAYSPASVTQFDALAQLAAAGLIPGVPSIAVPATVPIPFRDYMGSLRFDFAQSSKSQWFLRSSEDSYITRNALVQQGTLPSTGLTTHNNYWNTVLSNSYAFSPTWLGTLVLDASLLHLTQTRNSDLGFALAFPFSTTTQTISGFETFGDNQFATPITLFPDLRNQEKYQVRYDLSRATGDHSLKFGVNFIHEPVLSGAFAATAETLIQYASNPDHYLQNTGDFYFSPECAAGVPPDGSTCTHTPAGNGNFSQNVQRLAFYAQDSFRASHHLTVNYGLRYQTTFGLFTASGLSQASNPSFNQLVSLGYPQAVPHDFRKQFAPRLGIAYSPGGSERTVIRAGFGMFYNDLAQNGWATAFQAVNAKSVAPPSLIDPNYKTPYAIHVTGGVQHAFDEHWIVSADYTHEQGDHGYRAYPYPSATVFRSDNRSSYDALMLRVQGNVSRRFSLTAHYTLARAQTWGCLLGELFDYVNGVCDPYNAFNPRDYGPSGEDVRHRFVLAGTVHVPGGFELTTLTQAESARPFTITNATNDGRISVNGRPTSLDEFRGTPYIQADLRVSRPIKVGERWQINPFAEFFNLFNRNNPGANYVASITQLPIPPDQISSGNVTSICTVSDCSTTVPVTNRKQLEIPAGGLGDFFGPGTTVGIPFAAQLGVRVTF
ncbi:MAG: carboxypeptidase regulatory-like domain-containing protein [Acidobacteriia bacterium]|nr:carboxypeptidase regulatory-like domain-containing protein [Terriglobia bacterium]